MSETVVGFIVGGGLGFILGYIVAVLRDTRNEVHEVLEIERKHDEAGILNHRWAFNITFGFTVIFVFYAAFTSFQVDRELKDDQERDFIALCRSAEDIREVQRSTVDAVYALAISVVQSSKDAPPPTESQLESTNRFIERANDFREQSYKDIKPTESCLEHVDDDNVKPPTPPQPLLE